MNVYQRLNLAREDFHHANLKKSGHNKFAGYSYFELSDFVVTALSIFKKFGLTPFISFNADTATMKIVNSDKPEETIEITSPMAEANLKGCHPIQNLGAVQSYLRRYLWVAALEIVEHDALDASEPIKPKKTEAPIIPAMPAVELPADEMKYIRELAEELIDLVNEKRPEDAKTHLHTQNLENDQKIALWALLPSNVRSAIKK